MTAKTKPSIKVKTPVSLKLPKEKKSQEIQEITKKIELVQEEKPEKKQGKLYLLALLPILILGIILGTAVFFFNPQSKQKTADSKSITFTLIKESGKVEFKKSIENYQTLENDEIDLPSKSFVKTSEGEAHVVFGNNSMLSIDKNSEVEIIVDNQNTLINQLSGSTWNRVKKLTGSENYQVETPTALATVRGTKFGVELSKNPSEISGIYLVESKIDVAQKSSKKTETLNPKEYLEVKPNTQENSVKSGELLDENFQGRWYKRNRLIDQRYDSVEKMTAQIMQEMGSSSDMKNIDKSIMGTRKTDCLELLDQQELQKKDKINVEISKPTEGQVFTSNDNINFQTDSFNPCTQNSFDDKFLSWYLNEEKNPFGTGKNAEKSNLPEGNYSATVKGMYNENTYEDKVNFVVKNPTEPSPTNPIIPRPRPAPTPNPNPTPLINQAPIAKISPLKYTTYNSKIGPVNKICFGAGCIHVLNLTINGTGTDPEDGNLSGSNLTWFINDVQQATTGNTLTHTFQTNIVPKDFKITLKATDSKGLSNTSTTKITLKHP